MNKYSILKWINTVLCVFKLEHIAMVTSHFAFSVKMALLAMSILFQASGSLVWLAPLSWLTKSRKKIVHHDTIINVTNALMLIFPTYFITSAYNVDWLTVKVVNNLYNDDNTAPYIKNAYQWERFFPLEYRKLQQACRYTGSPYFSQIIHMWHFSF